MDDFLKENKIKLVNSQSLVTADPNEYYTVLKGKVYVYIQFTEDGVLDRSLYLCSVKAGGSIPSLACKLPGTENKWRFMIKPINKATLIKSISSDNNAALGNDFANSIEGFPVSNETDYQKRFVRWYIGILASESEKIEKIRDQKMEAEEDNFYLIDSIFNKKSNLKFDSSSDSPLYNAVSVLCNYLNIPISSYQNIYNLYGSDFSIQDIARMSRFIVRKVTLSKNWYKQDAGCFIAFKKDKKNPVLCIPGGIHKYVLYDIEKKTEKIIEEEEANELETEAYVIYRHFSGQSIKLRDVFEFGFNQVRFLDVFLFVVMFILSTLIGLLLPFLNEKMYDELIPLGQSEPIYQLGVVIFVSMMGNLFFQIVRNLSNMRAIKTMEYSIMAATYDRVFKLSQKFIEKFGSIELINRSSSVMGIFSQTVTSGVSAVMGFILSFFYLHKMFKECKTLAWRGLFMALISAVVMFAFGYLRVSKERERQVASTKANGLLFQYMSGILKLKVSGLENRGLYEFQKANVENVKYDMRSTKISNIGGAFSAIMTVAYSGVIYYTVVKKSQELTIGQFSSFNSAYGMFNSAVGQLVSFFITIASLIPVMERVAPIFEEPCEIRGLSKTVKKINGGIEIDHLDFSYDDDTEVVLKDISLSIKPGEYIGIVGPSGCGKSTLIKLILGFEEPTKGNIFFDDRDILTLDKNALRKQMGVVLQDGKMVVGNIYSNITLSNPNMEPSEAEELLDVVGLREDVDRMPMGIFTTVSEGGGTLSGGQQQRILIARALANKPKILLMDEATSALDNVTQQRVCENIAGSDITRIMIAHRLSTVKNCDRIYVMNEGRIAEIGNYESLMKQKGLFYELVKRQEI